MVKPFYQGKLDTFCAIYAVLNALRLTHGIRVLKARDILNETLLALAGAPEAFRAVLDQETDYLNLVDGMLPRRSGPQWTSSGGSAGNGSRRSAAARSFSAFCAA